MRKAAISMLPLATILLVGSLSPSEAVFRRIRSHYEPGEVVVAHSRFGNGSISGVVRPTSDGWEVRLPHGTWVECRRSCEETLRVQTVDLTEQQEGGGISGYGTAAQECGLFRCLTLGF
jgi:hypothetical protein